MSLNVDSLKSIATLIDQIGDAEVNAGLTLNGTIDVCHSDGEVLGEIKYNSEVEPTFSTS